MIEEIKNYIGQDNNSIEVIKIIGSFFIAFITAKYTARNTRKELVAQHFKDRGTEVQGKILSFWCTLFLNNFIILNSYNESFNNNKKMQDVEVLNKVNKESYVYCSAKTIRAIRDYQQYIYRNNNLQIDLIKEDSKVKKALPKLFKLKISTYTQFILISRIISRMKYDFTGEKVDELDLIKIKINDFNIYARVISRIILWYYNLKEIFYKLVMILIIILICYKLFL